jgi:hypothetical protein
MITSLEGCQHLVAWGTPTTINIILQLQTNNSLPTILSSHANNNNNNLTLSWQVNSRQIRANRRKAAVLVAEYGLIITKCIWGEQGVMDICIDLRILTPNKDNKVME